ncbi:hypothetical protein GSH19_06510 [Lactobacillus sp. S2-2]|uniref:EF-P 5-aminopentanol modification-associated protein YfmF n=1 Tax=Lactobacillus sp. S2-2 TaxID=2692917 RepID=UPI001F28CF60|nr:insulinase family protein [Lactobacillus sp. S2-2]MCF6515795.1 hypothetical protein [Lactobacillus sp. S2-2]
MKLNNGINVDYFFTKKFKNNTIVIDFITNIKIENFAKRAILADLMDDSNKKYPQKSILAKKLSQMYGANFAVTVLKVSNQHILRVIINFVNENYISEKKSLFLEVISFLKSVIFNPLADGKKFDKKNFELQRDNMIDYLVSLKDNPRFYSSSQLKKLYFKDNPENSALIIGNEIDYQNLNNLEVYQYYENMINQDDIEIKLLGDFENVDFINEFNQMFNYKKNHDKSKSNIISTSKHELIKQTENYQGNGSILGLAYYLPFQNSINNYFISLVLNGLLTSNNHSLLFDEIREKNSLAYYVNSNYNIFDEMFTIQTGINAKDKDQVIDLINEQIDRIIKLDYSDELLKNTKLTLVDDLLTKFDSQKGIVSEMTISNYFNLILEPSQGIEVINKISKDNISNFLKTIKIQAIHLLVGESND